jgi:BNR repeat-like domain
MHEDTLVGQEGSTMTKPGLVEAEVLKTLPTATANLPVAATSQDGRILIENVDATNVRLVVYAQGQRFRTAVLERELITGTVVDDGKYNAFPGLCELPNGDLICLYRAGTDHTSADGVIKYKTSSNQGAIWSAAGTVYDPGATNKDARDPEVILLSNGTLLASFFEVVNASDWKVYVSIGTITGGSVSWGNKILASNAFSTGFGPVCTSKVIELINGTILLPIYGRNSGETFLTAAVVPSTDFGATWGSKINFASDPMVKDFSEANGVQLPTGRIVMIVRSGTLKGYYEVHSLDNNGTTWSTPVPVINIGTSTPGRPTVVLLANGDLFLITRNTGSSALGRAAYATSWNNGTIWSALTDYGTDTAFEYASAHVLHCGRVGAVISREHSSNDAHIVYQEFTAKGSLTL